MLVQRERLSPLDAYIREFRLVTHKRYRFEASGPAGVEPTGYPRPIRTSGILDQETALRARIQEMERSRSWWATAWLRRFGGIARQFRDREVS